MARTASSPGCSCASASPSCGARDVEHKRTYVNFVAAAFFVGGIGRFLALVLAGVPHPFYVAMLVVELALPPLMVLAAKRVEEPAPIGS